MMAANDTHSSTNNVDGDDLVIPHSLPNNSSNQQSVEVSGTDFDFEIVGLSSNNKGRFCCHQKICVEHL
jgi:hypothetical protein